MSSTIKVNAIEPEGATTTLTIGKSTGDVIIDADSVKSNVLKDGGGNSIFTSDGSGNLSGVNAAFGSAYKLVASTTASDSAYIAFGSSVITNSYKEYVFRIHGMRPATDEVHFCFNVSGNNGSPYSALTKTTCFGNANVEEDGTGGAMGVDSGMDVTNSTDDANLCEKVGNDADQSCSGEIQLQNPSSTTYHRLFYSRMFSSKYSDYIHDTSTGGMINSGTACDYIRFMFSSGNIASGTISVWGIA